MAQSIKKVGDAALQILFKPGTYHFPNHDYGNRKILNRFVCLSKQNITSELLSDQKKLVDLKGFNVHTHGLDMKNYYWGLKSGLQKLPYDTLKETGSDRKLSLLNGLLNLSDKWKEQRSDKLLLFCSHIIICGTSHHADAMYETVIISKLSKELIDQLVMRSISRATE